MLSARLDFRPRTIAPGVGETPSYWKCSFDHIRPCRSRLPAGAVKHSPCNAALKPLSIMFLPSPRQPTLPFPEKVRGDEGNLGLRRGKAQNLGSYCLAPAATSMSTDLFFLYLLQIAVAFCFRLFRQGRPFSFLM